jgi:ABC-type polysaccharide/polyol phosphate export permease
MSSWLADTAAVATLEFYRFLRDWAAFAVTSLMASSTFFLFRLVGDPPPEAEVVFLAGAVVFGVGMQAINSTGQVMISERFEGQMKLFRTSPIAQSSYVVAVVAFAALTSMLSAFVVLGLAALAGVSFHFSPLLLPLLVITAFSLPGIAVIIATWARTAQTGYMLTNVIGIMVAFMSPVFYPVERLPEWLQWLAQVSPFTHAAVAFREVLTGGTDILAPVLVMVAVMIVTLTFGILKMRWRET